MTRERKVARGTVTRPTRSARRSPRGALLLAAAGVLLLVFAGACGRGQLGTTETKDDYEISFATDPAPPNQGASTVVVTIKDKQGQSVDAARVSIEANMNHAGMTPENAEATFGANGEYRMPLNWTMGGEWYVDVTITLTDGEAVRRRFPVDVK
jgi:hypothetical protein